MHINSKPLSQFGANLLLRKIFPASLDVPHRWPSAAKSPWISKNKRWGFKSLTLSFEFRGDHQTIETNKSRLIRELAECDLQFVENGRYYHVVLLASDVGIQPYGFEVLNVELLGYEYEAQVTIEASPGQSIVHTGTADTPVTLTLTASNSNPINITGLGEPITLTGLTSGQTIIIDGESGSVTIDGLNAYDKYESWSFPFIKPGENEINIFPAVAVQLEYKPRWL